MNRTPSARRTARRLLLACVFLAACVDVRATRRGESIDLAPDQVLVFGRLKVADRGVALYPPRIDLDLLSERGQVDFRPSLFQVETGKKAVRPTIEDDGTFWWILPRGTYLVFDTAPGPMPGNEVLVAFQTPRDARAVYVGILDLDIASDPDTGPPAEYRIDELGIGDEFDTAVAALHERHPGFTAAPARALMFHDPEFPGLFADYSRGRCEKILARNGLRPLDR